MKKPADLYKKKEEKGTQLVGRRKNHGVKRFYSRQNLGKGGEDSLSVRKTPLFFLIPDLNPSGYGIPIGEGRGKDKKRGAERGKRSDMKGGLKKLCQVWKRRTEERKHSGLLDMSKKEKGKGRQK